MDNINTQALTSTTLEKGLIGSLLIPLIPVSKALGRITDDLFNNDTTKSIWLSLKASNSLLSASEIIEACHKRGVKIEARDIAAMKLEAQGANVDSLIAQLMDYRDRRVLVVGLEKAMKDVMELDKSGVEVASDIRNVGGVILNSLQDNQKHDIFDTVVDIHNRMNGKSVPLLSSGLKGVDASLGGGWELGTLNVIGGRSGTGKTAFAMFIMRHGYNMGKEVGFISMEMTDKQMDRRELAMETGIPYHFLKSGLLDESAYKRIVAAAERINGNRYYRTTCGQLDVDQLRVEIAKMVHVHGVKYIFVDYLQRIKIKQHKGSNTAYEIANLCSSIKGICIEYNVCIILLSQLNRESAKGKEVRKPTITDLRDSGGIEENMDSVLLLYKPKDDGNGTPVHNMMTVINVKNRDGESNDEIDITVDLGVNQFYDRRDDDTPF